MGASEREQRSEARRKALLQAAADVFFEQGYVATSIDAIIERTGGSKRNIYSEFGSKQGLFIALVMANADAALSTLPEADGCDLCATLTTFGQHLIDVYMSPTVIGIYRIAVTEAHRFPELAKAFHDQGPGRTITGLADVLDQARRRGDIRVDDGRRLAEHFVSLIRGDLHLQVVLGLRPPPTPDEAREAVASAVRLFLVGVRARDG